MSEWQMLLWLRQRMHGAEIGHHRLQRMAGKGTLAHKQSFHQLRENLCPCLARRNDKDFQPLGPNPSPLNHRGLVAANGVNFEGIYHFKEMALADVTSKLTYWSTDDYARRRR